MIKKIIQGILLVIFPLLVLLFSTFLFLLNWPTHEEFLLKYTKAEDGLIVGKQVLEYLKNKDTSIPFFQEFTQVENEHMQEVKTVIQKVSLLFALLIFFFSISVWFVNSRDVFFYGSLFAIIICLLFLILPFSLLFTEFHKPLFSKQWMFSADSKIIQVFSLEFFQAFTSRIFSHALGMFMIILIMSSPLFHNKQQCL
ncbi:DUF1461 domain-containing protein [Candidatus Woesearchaeota archaeon]|nr:DUF1461 domain-containing protein [Candidatus Woesearchaeota archaeon]